MFKSRRLKAGGSSQGSLDSLASKVESSKQVSELFEYVNGAGLDKDVSEELKKKLSNFVIQTVEIVYKELSRGKSPSSSAIMKQQPIAQKLAELKGYSLLLLKVSSLRDGGNSSREFIVGVTDSKADKILSKTELTVIDFEREEIVRGFGAKEEVTSEAKRSAIEYFQNHFVTNLEMKMDYKA